MKVAVLVKSKDNLFNIAKLAICSLFILETFKMNNLLWNYYYYSFYNLAITICTKVTQKKKGSLIYYFFPVSIFTVHHLKHIWVKFPTQLPRSYHDVFLLLTHQCDIYQLTFFSQTCILETVDTYSESRLELPNHPYLFISCFFRLSQTFCLRGPHLTLWKRLRSSCSHWHIC